MRNFKPLIILLVSLSIFFGGCKKKNKYQDFELIDQQVRSNSVDKNRLKTEAQYVSILKTDMTQKPITPSMLYKYVRVLESIGDRELAAEIIVSNLVNDPNLKIPSDAYMREDLDRFIEETYVKFFIRYPTEAEKAYFKGYIGENPSISAEMVYTSFVLSAEYMFY
jgi:hypothetical protein